MPRALFFVFASLAVPEPGCLPPTLWVEQRVLRACALKGSERSQSLLQAWVALAAWGGWGSEVCIRFCLPGGN